MEDDVLIDVFRPLSRRQLSQSIALVCRRFHRLSNSPYLPNLHVIWSLWTLPIGRPRGRQKRIHRPPQYLRFESVFIRAEHLAQEQWRDCLKAFSHCFMGSFVGLGMRGMCTSLEFQCFLADWILSLFPNGCHYSFAIEFITGTDHGAQYRTKAHSALPTLEQLANYKSDARMQKTVASVPLLSCPALLNCSCLMITCYSIGEPLVVQEDIVQWLHHVPTMPAPFTEHNSLCKSKRNLCLRALLIKPHGRPYYLRGPNGHYSNIFGELLETANNVVEQIKKRFLAAKTSNEKREFRLELEVASKRFEEFDIRNDATNESLTCRYMPKQYEHSYCISRKSA